MIQTEKGQRGVRIPIVIGLMLMSGMIGAAVGTIGLLWSTGGLSEASRDAGSVVATLEVDASSADALDTRLYRITEDESEARFKIDETFSGNPIEVVGTTKRLAGDVMINFASPADSQIGDIAINVRTLKTDQEFRDQSIRGQILESSKDEFEFVTFAPASLENLPQGTVNVGDEISFQIVGDLTIKDTIETVTFDATVTVEEENRVSGLATTTVQYADYGITINPPPLVLDIGDTVTLEIDFVALAVEDESDSESTESE